jgi:hypothetical protein
MTMPITPEQIATLRQLDAKRTPGPWREVDGGRGRVLICVDDEQAIIECYARCFSKTHYPARVNRAFIVAAATAIIPALDEIERLRQALTTLDSICGNEIADEPENFRLLTAMQQIVRNALAPPDTDGTAEGVTE